MSRPAVNRPDRRQPQQRAKPVPWILLLGLGGGISLAVAGVACSGRPVHPTDAQTAASPSAQAEPVAVTAVHPVAVVPLPGLQASLDTAFVITTWRTPVLRSALTGDPAATTFDDSTWQSRQLPWDWTSGAFSNNPDQVHDGLNDASNWGGVRTGLAELWFRARITVPEPLRSGDLVLDLGAIGDRDETFWNGRRIGGLTDPLAQRSYRISKADVQADNVVAVRVRHEAPGAQQAHANLFWGHAELGQAFWPGGIWEQAPQLRACAASDTTTARVAMPRNVAADKEPQLTWNSSSGRFWRSGVGHLDLTLTATKPTANSRVRVRLCDLDGVERFTSDVAAPTAGTAIALRVPLPTLGWFRLEAQLVGIAGTVGVAPVSVDCAALAAHPTGPRLASRFGLVQSGGVTSTVAEAITAVGGRWARWDLPWDRFEHRQGEYIFNQHEQLDGAVETCERFALGMMPCFGYCAEWNIHPEVKKSGSYWLFSPPADPEAFRRASAKLAQHYAGRVQAWQIWNEPMNGHFLLSVEGKSVQELYATRIFPQAAEEIRKADPKATILFSSQWAEPFGEVPARYPQLADAAAVHPYSADEPELGVFARVTTNSQRATGGGMGAWKAEADGLRWMAPATPGRYALWITETGWFPAEVKGEVAAASQSFDRRHVASFIPRAYCTATFRGVQKLFYFALGGGLFSDDLHQAHPSAAAYSTTAHLLEGCRPLALMYLRRGLPCYIWQDETDATRFVGVTWSQGGDISALVPPGLTATSFLGAPVALSNGVLPITSEAVFLEAKAADPTAARTLFATIRAYGTPGSVGEGLWRDVDGAQDWYRRIRER